jgi:ABC-type Zn uptake system ZnuABC Zn-binding protein ZnuA
MEKSMRLRHLFGTGLMLMATVATAFTPTTAAPSQTNNPALKPCTPGQTVPVANPVVIPPPAGDKPVLSIVTTVSPITNLTFNVAGNRVKIHGLVPEGVNSHTFEPRPSDAAYLADADLVFVNGLELELPTMKLAEANLKQGAELIQLGPKAIEEIDWVYDFSFPKDGGKPNPHLWINPLLALNYANTIREVLSQRDPAGADYYRSNFEQLQARIMVLDQAICDVIQTIPAKNRKLLTYHDSYAYFSPRYGMTVLGAIQPADFSEPSAREIADLIDQIKTEGIPAIFGSEVFPSPVLEQIGKETGARFIDTLSDDSLPNADGDRNYHSFVQLMVDNITTISTALGGDPAGLKVVNTTNVPGPDSAVTNSREE